MLLIIAIVVIVVVIIGFVLFKRREGFSNVSNVRYCESCESVPESHLPILCGVCYHGPANMSQLTVRSVDNGATVAVSSQEDGGTVYYCDNCVGDQCSNCIWNQSRSTRCSSCTPSAGRPWSKEQWSECMGCQGL